MIWGISSKYRKLLQEGENNALLKNLTTVKPLYSIRIMCIERRDSLRHFIDSSFNEAVLFGESFRDNSRLNIKIGDVEGHGIKFLTDIMKIFPNIEVESIKLHIYILNCSQE